MRAKIGISCLLLLSLLFFLSTDVWADPVAKIVLTADPISVPADGEHSVAITATLTDRNGLIPTGTTVTFTTDRGVFKNGLQSYSELNAGGTTGIVVVSLISILGDSGIAQVTCTADGVIQYIAVIFESAATIKLTANPTWIPADGSSSTTITAVLTGSNLSSVPAGTEVTFTTDKGKFQNGLQTITQITLASTASTSSVVVSLIADTTTGLATVTCSTSEASQNVTVAMGDLSVASIALAADPLFIPADGVSSSLITATLKDSKGSPVAVGTSATFTTTHGTFSNTLQTISVSTSDSSGIIKVSLIAATTNDIADVVCTSSGISQTISIGIGSSIGGITLSATPGKIPADGISSSAIGARIVDTNNVLIGAGIPVTFETTLGTFSNGSKKIEVITTIGDWINTSENVSVSLIAGTASGTALVSCKSGSVTQAIKVEIGDKPAATIKLTADPEQIPADGKSSSIITATVTDNGGTPIANGAAISFSTTLGKFSNGLTTIAEIVSNGAGSVKVSLMSGTVSGIATVVCSSSGVTQAISVEIGNTLTPQVAGITLAANPTKIPADGLSSSLIKAVLVDGGGSPALNGTSVTFTTTLGLFSNNTTTISVTVSNGQGSVSVSLISVKTSGIATVVCSSGGVSQSVSVQIGDGTADPVAGIVLTASPEELPADGYSSSLITAVLTNSSGLPVAKGTSVKFTTTLGTFSNSSTSISSSIVNDTGKIQVSLLAGTKPGNATVVCIAGGVSQAIVVQMGSGSLKPVAMIYLTVSPDKIPADGYSSAVVTATLQDSGGNPVGDGTEVHFTTTLGHFSNNSTSITVTIEGGNGTASVSLISGTTSGIASIVCSSNGVTQITGIQIGNLPTASIILTADPSTLFADGYSMTLITAYLIDSQGQPVAKGTSVTFTAIMGLAKFSNGKTTITVSTPNDSGLVSVSLIAGTISGLETVTCTSSGITQSIIIRIVKMQYETEPNNEMAEADRIIFGDAYHAQLASPYDTDWYVYTSTQSGVISLNFITTAIPEGAGCDGTTTVGTYRIDVRDTQNNVLMSYQNIDCTFDNGIWETGVQSPGTYYIVVYCPRQPSVDHYLSSSYYISAYQTLIPQCKPDIRANGLDGAITVTSATPVSITVSMEAGEQNGLLADWWVIYSSPYGYYSLTFYGWLPGIYSLAQYPVINLPTADIFYQYLYPGNHVFYFGVDINPNGIPDSPLFYDSVEIYVSP